MEWKGLQQLLQQELNKVSQQLSKDLRTELSQILSQWLAGKQLSPVQDAAPSPKHEVRSEQPLTTPMPASGRIEQPLATPAPLMNEFDIARLRMKARTYTSADGICAPIPQGGVTMLGTPKSQPGQPGQPRKSGFGFARSSTVTSLAEAGKRKTTTEGIGDESPKVDEGKKEESRNSNKSRTLRAPRSIFVHHLSTYAPEGDGSSEEAPSSTRPELGLAGESVMSCLRRKIGWLVTTEAFDYVMGLAIFANAILMGIQADLAVTSARTGELEPPFIRGMAVMLGVVFTVELVLRIFAQRLEFFTKPGWRWNLFDFLLVFLQISEEVVTAVVYVDGSNSSRSVNLSFMRILRVLRLVRIVRLVRVLRLIRELRTLVQSIASTMTSLLWTVVLLLLLIFVVGICFTQVVADVGLERPGLIQVGTDTYEFYGSLSRSVMSLYQSITSGVSWRDASQPLEQLSPVMGLVFAVYIAFAALAMLNVITGVFVESAMASAREENMVTVVSRMREIVSKMNIGESGQMTWEQFEGQLDNPVMEAYFRSLDLSISEARSLFVLLDIDEQGYIDVEEFIAGCCRVHGPAKAIDLTTLMCQVRKLHLELREHATYVLECLSHAGLATPVASSTLGGSPRHRRQRPPSFHLTPNPEHALAEVAEESPSAHMSDFQLDSPLSRGGAASRASSSTSPTPVLPEGPKLQLPLSNLKSDSWVNLQDWAKSTSDPKISKRPLSL